VGNPDGKRPVGKPSRRWMDDIKIYLGKIGGGGMDCFILLRLVTGGGLM
jgi:hypothetical protein